MEYIVIAFRSRNHTIKFNGILNRSGVNSSIINTPKEAGVGCGLSVKIDVNKFSFAKKMVFLSKLNSFAGFFLVKRIGNRVVIKTI